MAADDAGRAGSDDARCFDVWLLFHREYLRANKTSEAGHEGDRQADHRIVDAGPQSSDDGHRHEETGERHDRVDDAHEDRVDSAPEASAHETDQCSTDEGQHDCEQRGIDRSAGGEHHATERVVAGLVGAEEMIRRRTLEEVRCRLVDVVGRNPRSEESGRHDHERHDEPEERGLLTEEPVQHQPPTEVAAPFRGRGFERGEIDVGCQGGVAHERRTFGLRREYARSTSRLTPTTMTAITSMTLWTTTKSRALTAVSA